MSAPTRADRSVPLPDLDPGADLAMVDHAGEADGDPKVAGDLEAVFDVPVAVSAVLGRAKLEVRNLMKLKPGAIIELDRKIGEAIDIYVNDRLVARGEIVLVEDQLGVTMTEIIKPDRA
ncbi:flagellar motor switch protein FliN [Methylopila sp. M107]|uniref:flagellar motor switch protein FliN n=1 Tax=Methylopila sp. M107 TaxID=1101190 RepID=UPI000374867B|nr:flagellar motor switch protein FliN [Methylopila sp. M107]